MKFRIDMPFRKVRTRSGRRKRRFWLKSGRGFKRLHPALFIGNVWVIP